MHSPDTQTSNPQPDQVEIHPEPGHIDIDIVEDIPNPIDVPEELLLGFHSWTHSLLDYQW